MPVTGITLAFKSGTEKVSGGMNMISIASILLFFLAMPESTAWQFFIMIRSLQLTTHLPMLRIVLPANLMTFIEQLIPVLGFDLLGALFDWE